MFRKICFILFHSIIYTANTEDDVYPHGLGGANISVICQPTMVQKGGVVNVQVNYTVDVVRPIDLHFDILQEPEKKWLAGNQIPLHDNNGSLSINLTLPLEFDEKNVLWKLFLTPRGDRFPNMLAETGLLLPIGDQTNHQCPYSPLESNIVIHENIDFILIQYCDTELLYLHDFNIEIIYALNTLTDAQIDINIMNEDTNEWIWGLPSIPIENTNHKNKSILIKGSNFIHELLLDPIYLDVSLVPSGKTWYDRLAEDRTYRITYMK